MNDRGRDDPRPEFDDFYSSHRDRIVRALALTVGDVHLAAEATDEAMVRAFERWKKISGYANPGGWVYRVGLNWARSRLRRRQVVVTAAAVFDDPIGSPEVVEALQKLSEDHRAVVVLRYYLDYPLQQIAETLDIALGTVKSRLHRAHNTLAPLLEYVE